MEKLDQAVECRDYRGMEKILKKAPWLTKFKYMNMYFRDACWKDDMLMMQWFWSHATHGHYEMVMEGIKVADQHRKYEMSEMLECKLMIMGYL